jgi:hypothetical protein
VSFATFCANPFLSSRARAKPKEGLASLLDVFVVMSKFDIQGRWNRSRDMNVSLPEAMVEFVRQKVAIGDYGTASEVFVRAFDF